MKDITGDMDLSIDQATHIARAMYRVAVAEHGVHEQEKKMIDAFYLECCRESGSDPEDLSAGHFDADAARASLDTAELKDVALRSCLLVGYADGQCSSTERRVIEAIAREIGADPSRVPALEKDIRRSLLESFEGLKVFREAAFEIGKRLGMTPEEVEETLKTKGE